MDEEIKKKAEDIGTGMEEIDEEDTETGKFFRKMGINPNLVMLKVTLFVMYGATASLLPYLTIHMQSIGLTVPEISFVYLALPFTTFLSPPITGFLVDKFGQYKPVVIITLILNAAFHHSLLFIPHQETPGIMPSAYVMRHPISGDVEIWWSPCPSRECPEEETIDLVLGRCADHCALLQPRAATTGAPELTSTITTDADLVSTGDLNFDDTSTTPNGNTDDGHTKNGSMEDENASEVQDDDPDEDALFSR